jgi:tetratricopeptide (TPR) repeat protein
MTPTTHTPSTARIALGKLANIGLNTAALGALLAAAVSFVYAAQLIAEGKLVPFLVALASGLASLLLAWLLRRGAVIVRRRTIEAQVARCAEAVGREPSICQALCTQGIVHGQRRDFARAIAYFDAAIDVDPTHPNAYVGRVNAYGAVGQFDRVIADYSAAIARDPNDALAYCARATAYNGIGRFDRSVPDATEAIRLAPDLYLGHDARGYGLLQRGGFNWAIKLIGIMWMGATLGFLRRDSFDWRTPAGSRADYAQAVADFTEALRLMPTACDCLAGRAQANRALGETAKAEQDERRVRERSLINS